MTASSRGGSSPSTICRSVLQTPQARTFKSAESFAGCGTGTVSIASGRSRTGAGCRRTAARMVEGCMMNLRGADSHCSSTGMRHRAAECVGSGLRRDVALRGAEQLKADHEFADGCGAQQRRIEVRVQLPLGMFVAVEWGRVKAH